MATLYRCSVDATRLKCLPYCFQQAAKLLWAGHGQRLLQKPIDGVTLSLKLKSDLSWNGRLHRGGSGAVDETVFTIALIAFNRVHCLAVPFSQYSSLLLINSPMPPNKKNLAKGLGSLKNECPQKCPIINSLAN